MTDAGTIVTFEPPGPGTWEHDLSHCPPAATPLFQRVASTTMTTTYRSVFERWGAPLDTMEVRFVEGKMYRRLVPLVGAERTGPPPPNAVLWLATRLHPAFRRRERLARKTLAERPYLDVVAGWYAGEREAWIDRNLAIQAIDPATLDDAALARHVEVLDDHLVQGWERHHELHGSDLGPIGDLLAHGRQWGLDPVAVMGLLRGASPATLEGQQHGRRMADALAAAGVDPTTVTSIAEIRAVPEASAALDDYLEQFGWRVVTSYDIEGLTIGELPSATCALVRACAIRRRGERVSRSGAGAGAGPRAGPADVRRVARRRPPCVRDARRQRTADRRVADGAAAPRLPGGGRTPGRIRAAARGRPRLRARQRRGRGDAARRIEPQRRRSGSTGRAAPPPGRDRLRRRCSVHRCRRPTPRRSRRRSAA